MTKRDTYQVKSQKTRIDWKGNKETKVKYSIVEAASPNRAKRIVKTWNKGTAWNIVEVRELS